MAREGALRRVDAVGSGAPVGGPGAPLDRGARRGGARAHPRAGADRGEPEPDRPLGQQSTDGPNHGKKPRKFIQDCTICRSCRRTISASALLKQRKNRTQMAGDPGRIRSVSARASRTFADQPTVAHSACHAATCHQTVRRGVVDGYQHLPAPDSSSSHPCIELSHCPVPCATRAGRAACSLIYDSPCLIAVDRFRTGSVTRKKPARTASAIIHLDLRLRFDVRLAEGR